MDVNQVLKDYDHIIRSNVMIALNYNIGVVHRDKFLQSRCITIEDVMQEVRIKIWKLLEEVYNSKSSLEVFIGFQSVRHATWFIKNIRNSSSCMTGSKDFVYSMQSNIDNNKDYIEWYPEDNDLTGLVLYNKLQDHSYIEYGLDIDYHWLIEEVCRRLGVFNKGKELSQLFILFVEHPELFTDVYGTNNISAVLKQYSGDKHLWVSRMKFNRIIDVVKEVIEDYKYKLN